MSPLVAFFLTVFMAVLLNILIRQYLPETCEECSLRGSETLLRSRLATVPVPSSVPAANVVYEDFD